MRTSPFLPFFPFPHTLFFHPIPVYRADLPPLEQTESYPTTPPSRSSAISGATPPFTIPQPNSSSGPLRRRTSSSSRRFSPSLVWEWCVFLSSPFHLFRAVLTTSFHHSATSPASSPYSASNAASRQRPLPHRERCKASRRTMASRTASLRCRIEIVSPLAVPPSRIIPPRPSSTLDLRLPVCSHPRTRSSTRLEFSLSLEDSCCYE